MKNSARFHISAQSIDCGYSLEPPRRGGSNEYPQSMFLSRNKKNNVYPCKPQFYCIKVGFKGGGGGSKLYRRVFVMLSHYIKSTQNVDILYIYGRIVELSKFISWRGVSNKYGFFEI